MPRVEEGEIKGCRISKHTETPVLSFDVIVYKRKRRGIKFIYSLNIKVYKIQWNFQRRIFY